MVAGSQWKPGRSWSPSLAGCGVVPWPSSPRVLLHAPTLGLSRLPPCTVRVGRSKVGCQVLLVLPARRHSTFCNAHTHTLGCVRPEAAGSTGSVDSGLAWFPLGPYGSPGV